jgi:hypothetical protein
MKRSMISAAILGALGLSSTFSVLAVNVSVELCAGPFEKTLATLPATQTPIPMWGYSLGGMTNGACDITPTAPGPRITIPDANDGLDIVLHNALPIPTSIVIPGTVKRMTPVLFTAPDETMRVRSFDVETVAGTTSTVPYSWNNLAPGSYMYHSGTHPQVQVQMGLYGAVTDNFSTNTIEEGGGEAYEGQAFSQDVVLFYSEIDRAIHESVAAGNHNVFKATITEADMQSTINYAPKIFLIDVDTGRGPISYEFNDLPTLKILPTFNPLVRFFNAGLETHVPTVFEADFDVIAEDGKLYPNVRKQYSVALPPLKTKDAYMNINGSSNSGGPPLSPTQRRTFRLTDSAMAVSNPDSVVTGPVVFLSAGDEIANGTDNGMVLHIEVAASDDYVAPVISGDEPKANRDNMSVPEGGTIGNIMAAATSNDQNTTGTTVAILSYPKHGELTDDGAGDFSYQHNGGEKSSDSMMYSITNAAGESSAAGIKIDVIPMNDAPVAHDDNVNTKVGQLIEIRPLNNDEDVDSPVLTISAVDASSLGTLENMGRVLVFTAATVGSEVVSYTIADAHGATASANINLTVAEATTDGTYIPPTGGRDGGGDGGTTGAAPEAVDDSYSVTEGSVLDIKGNTILGVMANDSLGATASTDLVEYPEHGALEMFADGTFIYTHDGSDDGSDDFTYQIYNDNGMSSAEVTITVTPMMDAPHVNNDRASTPVGTAVSIDLLKNDEDGDSDLDPNGIVISELPGHGTVEIATGGNVLYTPAAGYSGKDAFRYQLKDSITGELSARSAKVVVRVR